MFSFPLEHGFPSGTDVLPRLNALLLCRGSVFIAKEKNKVIKEVKINPADYFLMERISKSFLLQSFRKQAYKPASNGKGTKKVCCALHGRLSILS